MKCATRSAEALPFDQRLAMLVQRELDWRDGKRVARLLKNAKLKVSGACVEMDTGLPPVRAHKAGCTCAPGADDCFNPGGN